MCIRDRQDIDRLMACKTPADCLRALGDKGWDTGSGKPAEAVLAAETEKTWALMRELTPDLTPFNVLLYPCLLYTSWSARRGDTELPIGAYIYYLSVAYNEAAAQIDTETRVLEGEVEDTPAAEWITDRAASYINQYFWMQDEMERLGLTMTDDDYTQAQQTTDSYWSCLLYTSKNIIYLSGSDRFPRVKVGIGHKPEGWDLANWVLSRFSAEELKQLEAVAKNIGDAVEPVSYTHLTGSPTCCRNRRGAPR